MKIRLVTDIADALWTKLSLQRIGTSLDSDISAVKIYRDTGNGEFSEVDDVLVSNIAALSAPVLAVNATTISVNPTVGFSSTGKIKIDKEIISYTSLVVNGSGKIIGFVVPARSNPVYHSIGTVVTDGFFGSDSPNQAAVSLAGQPQVITTQAQYFFIVCQVDTGATPNANLGIQLASTGNFEMSFGNNPSGGPFPMATIQTVTIAEVKNNLTYKFVGPLGAKQNQTDIPVEKFTISTNNPIATAVFTGMRLQVLGSAQSDPSAITIIKIYKERNANDNFDLADDSPAIGSVNYIPVGTPGGSDFNEGSALISFNTPETITNVGTTFYIVIDIGDFPAAVPGTNVQIKFEVTGDQGHSTFLMITPANFASPAIGTNILSSVIDIRDKKTPQNPVLTFPDWIDTTALISGSVAFNAGDEVTEVEYTISTAEVTPAAAAGLSWYSVGKATNLQVVDLNLDPDKTYYVGVRTINKVGTTSYVSDPTSKAIKIDLTAPSDPTSVQTTAEIAKSNVATPSYTLVWNLARDLESGVVDYQVQERADTMPAWSDVKATINVENTKGKTAINNKSRGHIYYYKVRARNAAGSWGPWSKESKGVAIDELPKEVISMVSNYPNPFDSRTGKTVITYLLNQDADTTITIYDLLGHLVRTIECTKGTEGGQVFRNNVEWDGKNDIGDEVAKGGYICRIMVRSSEGVKQVIRKIGVLH